MPIPRWAIDGPEDGGGARPNSPGAAPEMGRISAEARGICSFNQTGVTEHTREAMSTAAAKVPDRSPSPAAQRMRRLRKRRRNKLRYMRILMLETEIDALVRKGFLDKGHRHNCALVESAVYDLISQALDDPDVTGNGSQGSEA